ncbi:PIN domain-containing protein [Sphingobacterium sp. SGG-5]|uniref:PIN domain-containing protein n=1 Tax=Sphingobacterium sp. SGG-5 TaxID=2710881 RepID=UPI0013EBFB87|nr:PIN domain-containing protein [Sphingobacterium sp. SGG-5]NGM62498.1 PIN domain-containing protein [Sphingobacterium sp. SGG-5]
MILVDTSVWIDYFRGGEYSEELSNLVRLDVVCTNEIILTELLPALLHRNQKDLIEALQALPCVPYTVFWEGIRLVQNLNIKNGINKVGLPDLMIAQHCMDSNLELWSLDKHFQLMRKHIALKLFKS